METLLNCDQLVCEVFMKDDYDNKGQYMERIFDTDFKPKIQ